MNKKRTSLEETLAASPLLVLDGSMSTPLENMGVGLNTKLWTARALADCPEKIKQVHKNYLKAGADCGITCSYQATIPGLMGIGYTKEQAEELVDFYQKPVDYINEQLKQVTDRKKVYWEYGDDYSTCIPGTSNDGWHNMILMAGGINIFGDASLAGKDIDPEQILTEDPDLIVKIYAGKNVIGNSGVFTAPPQEEFAEKADEMLKRPGWKDLKAVKEGNFYLNTAFMSGGLGKMIGAAYMAKWLYPDLMTDLDPDAIFTQWMKYQGFEPNAPHYYHVPAQG